MDETANRFFGKRGCVALAVVLVAVVVVGEASVIMSAGSGYGMEVSFDGGSAEYTVAVSGSDTYDAVLLDGNGSVPVTEIAIYIDGTYGTFFSEVEGVPWMEQEDLADQLTIALSNRGFDRVQTCDADGLRTFLEETLSDPAGLGLFVTSYALPSSVYSGDADDLLLRWVSAGGTLYWLGSEIGRYFTDGDNLFEAEGYQELLFGRGCINPGEHRYAESAVDNGFTDALSLSGSDLLFALDVTGIPGALSMGYQAGGYSTISMVPYGGGEICVFAGDFDIDLLDDVGQVIASGANHHTAVADHHTGKVTRGTAGGTFDGVGPDSTVYIYFGGMYTKSGGAFRV